MKCELKHASQLKAFSLIEIVVAMAIAALALVSIIGILPVALKDVSAASDQTAIGLMLEDIHERIEGKELTEGSIGSDTNNTKPFFYDQRGVYVEDSPSGEATISQSLVAEKFYRVELKLVKPTNQDLGEVLAVRVDLFWPIDSNGNAFSDDPSSSITYYTAGKAGRLWQQIDSNYQPKIEY